MLSAIKEMELYAQQYTGVVSLAQGIPGTPADALIKYDVIKEMLANRVDQYSTPAGMPVLRGKISEKLLLEGMDYSADEILVTVGATEAMTATLLALTNPGDEVIIPTPTYSAFIRSCQTAHLNVKEIKLNEGNEWELDIHEVKRQITSNTRAFIISNPNNPTGSLCSKKTFNELLDLAKKNNFVLIVDEVYKNMMYDDLQSFSPATDAQFKDHLIRIVSFSKDLSLTGWRIGFLQSSEQHIQKIVPIHDSLVNCAPVVSQYAALSGLKYERQIIAEHKALYKKHRTIVGESLSDLSEYFHFSWPKGSYFFFPKLLSTDDDRRFCQELLEKERLALVPGSEFGSGGEGHIRICFGRGTDDIIEAMKRLKKYCRKYA